MMLQDINSPNGSLRFLLSAAQFQDFVSRKGFPSRVDESVRDHIVMGDCVEFLKQLPDNCIDLVHTSPPYNIDKPYLNGIGDRTLLSEYVDFLTRAISQLKRVVRPGGSIFWQTGYTQIGGDEEGDILPIDIISYEIFRREPIQMFLWDRIIWRYWGGHAFKRKFTNKHETILWFVRPGAEPTFSVDCVRERTKEYDKRNNFWGRNPGNVWEVDRVAAGSSEQTSHIAVFPEELSEKIIRACSQRGDLVLDPFCGSGTVLKVARSLSRHWLGIEISDAYAREAAVRLGYQQPSEELSFASELLKTVVFNDRPGTIGFDLAVQKIQAWGRSARYADLAERFETKVALAMADRTRSKIAKRDVWMEYDARLGQTLGNDVVVEADRLLSRSYKNRRNLNGVSRYRSALAVLGATVPVLIGSKDGVASLVEAILDSEPSSYQKRDGHIDLLSVERRVQSSSDSQVESDESGINDAGLGDVGSHAERQTRLFR